MQPNMRMIVPILKMSVCPFSEFFSSFWQFFFKRFAPLEHGIIGLNHSCIKAVSIEFWINDHVVTNLGHTLGVGSLPIPIDRFMKVSNLSVEVILFDFGIS